MQLDELKRVVAKTLNLSLEEVDRFSISNLNDIPPALVEQARRLNELSLVMSYLRFYVKQSEQPYLQSFIEEVVFGGSDPRSWLKGGFLVPSVSLKDQLTKTKEQLFGDLLQEDVAMIPQEYDNWLRNGTSAGGFAFARPDANYRSEAPEGFGFTRGFGLQPVDAEQIPVLFRRWIASRIAMVLRGEELQKLPDTGYLERFADKNQWTEDAWIAIRGLTAEKENDLWGDGKVPGYCGPNTFYA